MPDRFGSYSSQSSLRGSFDDNMTSRNKRGRLSSKDDTAMLSDRHDSPGFLDRAYENAVYIDVDGQTARDLPVTEA